MNIWNYYDRKFSNYYTLVPAEEVSFSYTYDEKGDVILPMTKEKQQQAQQSSKKPVAWFFEVLGLKGDTFTKAEIKKARDFQVASIKQNIGSVTEIVRVNYAYWESLKHASDR